MMKVLRHNSLPLACIGEALSSSPQTPVIESWACCRALWGGDEPGPAKSGNHIESNPPYRHHEKHFGNPVRR